MGMKQFIYTVVQQAVREVITKEVNVRIDNVEKSLGQRIADVEKSLSQRIDALGQRVTDVEKNLGQRIDALDQRINGVEKSLGQRITDIEMNLIERFEGRFDSIEKSIATIQGNLEGEARFFHMVDYLQKNHAS
jgi:DNA anti-recombination protein RmuC